MNRKEQRAFVRTLSRNITRDVLDKSARWPAEWDGHELRALLRDAFADAVIGDLDARPRCGDPRRKRAYRNECLVRYLP